MFINVGSAFRKGGKMVIWQDEEKVGFDITESHEFGRVLKFVETSGICSSACQRSFANSSRGDDEGYGHHIT